MQAILALEIDGSDVTPIGVFRDIRLVTVEVEL